MPNQVKPETTSAAPMANKQSQPQAGATTPARQEPAPAGVPGRTEPKDGAGSSETNRSKEQDKPVPVAVEQKTS